MYAVSINKIRRAIFAALLSAAVAAASDSPIFFAAAHAADKEAARDMASGGRPGRLPPGWTVGKLPVLHYREDTARNRVWLLAADGVHVFVLGTRKEIGHAVLKDWIWAGDPYGCAPDLVLGPDGEALVSSDVSPTLWRVDPITFAVTRKDLALDHDTDKDVGFSGLAYSQEQGAFFAISHFHGSLWRIGPQLRSAQKIVLTRPVPGACGRSAVSPAMSWSKHRPASLCINSERGTRQVNLAPDLRSGAVVAGSCEIED
ncbi:MAG TPA: hypothetical protein VH105_15070 [Burkholderiales bacterium]|jgi:hypothetical protein|nr:hypothetical protein [Burkholderiales bacterium]